MKTKEDIIKLLKRQQVPTIALLLLLLVFGAWFFITRPMRNELARLEKTAASTKAELVRRGHLLDEDVLTRKRQDEEQVNTKLLNEWSTLSRRMSTFPDAAELLKTDIGRIEFKVALFDTQQRLLRKSRQLRIGLPHDIGMDGSVGGNEDARSMMFQLRALEKLVDFALDLKIGMVQKVEPLPVISHTIGDNNEVYLQEYPVGIEFLGSLENLYDLFYAVLEPDRVFILRHLQTETPEDNSGNPLKISAVMSALVFSKKPTEISEQQIKIRPLKPLGY